MRHTFLRISFLLFGVLCLSVAPISSAVAGLISITGGALTMTYDGTVFADRNSSSIPLTAGQDFMRYGRYWAPSQTVKGAAFTPKLPQEFRPLPISGGTGNPRQPNFRDNRATLDPLYPVIPTITETLGVNGNGPVANSTGRSRISTNFTFDTNNVLGTVDGLVQTNGVSAWWFANDTIMNSGGAWVSWGDLSLRYDASRTSAGYSGWIFSNQLGGKGDIFDTKNVTLNASASGIQISGELWGSTGDSSDPENENFATWETYTLMKPDLKVGNFEFNGFAAVPEPSSFLLLGLGCAGGALWRRFKRSKTTKADA